MSEKYIELKPQIASDYALVGATAVQGGVGIALEWLDRHPDQVPGRTITESRVKEKLLRRGIEFVNGWPAAMIELGATVIPDPEPTNFERLEDLVDQWRKGPQYKTLTQYLDDCGVKAPGGDE
ncbi:hypothetical protein [Brevibacterium sediminis]|uniref:hypothetical protein n=1 Tax=Brevibacterium sediminis TaxID=1857024 RepID=UPI0036728B90